MNKRNFRTYELGLTANVEFPMRVAGNMYAVISNTGDFTIVFDESNRLVSQTAGMGGEFKDEYSDVMLLSTTTQTVTVILGFGSFKDARASVNATVNTTIQGGDTINNPGDVSVGTAATLLIAANANRKEVEISVPSSEAYGIRVGNASVTNASGSLIEPGMAKWYDNEAALYGVREASATSDITATVFESERP